MPTVIIRSLPGRLGFVVVAVMAAVGVAAVLVSDGARNGLRALGFTAEQEVQFARVASLPDGGLLSAEKARQTTVAMMPSASTRESTTGTE